MRRALSGRTVSSRRIPAYRRHKSTGQAVVTLDGRDFYLGRYASPTSRAEYDRLVSEWLARGRSLPRPAPDLTVTEVAAAFLDHATGYYVKNGEPTGWQSHIKLVLKLVRTTYGHTPAESFGPLAFKTLRQKLVDRKLSRAYVNKLMSILVRMFKWAASEQLVAARIYQELLAVDGLRKGRCTAPDLPPVRPVDDAIVDETLPFLGRIVADMVRLQRLTGARPNELCIIRPIDVDRSSDVWLYRPGVHKTEHHDRDRVIAIGPKAQAVLRPYLDREEQAYCFSPSEAEAERRAAMSSRRTTPLHYGNRPGTNRKAAPQRRPNDCYTSDSYRRAIHRACEAADEARKQREKETKAARRPMPKWSPNRLRHSVGTEVRSTFGLEASQVVLGHAKADVTQVYAERDLKLAMEVARKIG
ncbi:MAG TPA: site-specific integrase [Planctomycetaceae bacterium]|nr:site-specific integrase [Planctomycetaceae bacterium]